MGYAILLSWGSPAGLVEGTLQCGWSAEGCDSVLGVEENSWSVICFTPAADGAVLAAAFGMEPQIFLSLQCDVCALCEEMENGKTEGALPESHREAKAGL